MRTRVVALATVVCTLPVPVAVVADDQAAWAQCAGLQEDQARLACYDLAAGRKAEPGSAKGRWIVSESVNPVDDTKTILAMLLAADGKSKYGKPIGLFVRCQSNVLDVFISWGQFLGDDTSHRANQKDITMRIGDDKAFPARWGISTDGTATFATETSKMHFLRGIVAKPSLVVRTAPYGSVPIVATFDVRGVAEALAPVMEACGHPRLEAPAAN